MEKNKNELSAELGRKNQLDIKNNDSTHDFRMVEEIDNNDKMNVSNKSKDDSTINIDAEIEELSLDDSKSNIELNTKNMPVNNQNKELINNQDNSSDVSNETDITKKDLKNELSDASSSVDSNQQSEPRESTDGDLPEEFKERDNRSLKEKANDAKENIKQMADDIKKAPERAKEKYDEAKDKVNEAKQRAKEVPDKLKQKRDDVKEKWDNRPKNFNDFKNRAKDKGTNLKDRAKNGIKNGARNVANKTKDTAVDGVKNSSVGQKVQEVKQKIENTKKVAKVIKKTAKLAVKAAHTLVNVISLAITAWPITLVVLVTFMVIVCVLALVPGAKGSDVEEYSKTDQKILTKIRKIVDEYPGADAELAMTTIVYPYFSVLWSDETISYLSPTITEELKSLDGEEEIEEDYEDYNYEDTEDIEIEDDEISDDPYLALFRKYNPHRKYLKQIIKKLNEGEGAYVTYLKDTYFNKNKAYKLMLKDSLNQEALIESIIKDIKDNKSLFANYVFKSSICSATMVPAGTVEIDDMLKGNILVDVKVPSCKSSKGVWDCQSVYSNPIPLKKYVFGGTYEEFNSMDVEKTAAQMLAIKSFITQRSKSMGWGVRRDGANYIVAVRNNTNDLVYCDVDLGCKSGTTEVGDGNAKRDPITEQQRAIFESAWEKVSNKYIYDKNNKVTVGDFCQSRSGECSSCTKGSCLSHNELESYSNTNYESIIAMQYSDYSIIEIDGDFANVNIVGDTDCSNASLMEIDDSNFVYYAQTDYPNVSYCGLRQSLIGNGICPRGNTICSHGCGTTSMAMVTATFTQNYSINPLTLNNEVRPGVDCGTYGTNGSSQFSYIANKYGLSYSYKAFNSNIVNDIKQVLDEGALIITSVCGGVKYNDTYTYGPCGGHFIVIRGYEGDSVIISDPFQNGYLKRYKACLVKNNEKCIKHKMSFDSFYNDLRAKGAGIHIIKGTIPFSELQKQNNTVSTTEN